MADKLISLETLRKEVERNFDMQDLYLPVHFFNVAEDVAEAVVRCKDCKHATMTGDGKMCKYCEMDTDDFGYPRCVYHDADWFCAYGVKRNG